MSDCLGYLTLGGHASFCKKKKKKKTIKFTLISVGTLNLLWSKLFNGSGFPGGASGKEPTNQSRRPKKHGWIPGWGRSLGGGLGNPLQYSCLENPMDRGAWQAAVHKVTKSQMWLKWHSVLTYILIVKPFLFTWNLLRILLFLLLFNIQVFIFQISFRLTGKLAEGTELS